MRSVVQRVKKAEVRVAEKSVARIDKGLLIFLGVERGDTPADASYLAEKIAGLRIFEDQEGKMNLSLKEIAGQALVISQFTLLGDCRKGKRPNFTAAAPAVEAEILYEDFCTKLSSLDVPVAQGQFQSFMEVELINEGPVTVLVDSKRNF
jgi:D-tyrosyl-tRNA(Tyr) deacylase